MSTQSHISQVFKQFCTKVGLQVHQFDVSSYVANVNGSAGKWPIFFHFQDTRPIISSVLPVTVPYDQRQAVMEYVTRANWGLSLGHFEMDLDEGEVRFTTSLELADGKLTHCMVGTLLATHFHTVDRYLPGLIRVLFTHQQPTTAIRLCEAESKDTAEPADLNELLNDVDVDGLPDAADD